MPFPSAYVGGSTGGGGGGGSGDMVAANNLSDVAVPATARTNLGLAIGTDVQAHSAALDGTTASFTAADETRLDSFVESDYVGPQKTELFNVTQGAASTIHTIVGYATLDALVDAFEYIEVHFLVTASLQVQPPIRIVAADWKAAGYPDIYYYGYSTANIRTAWANGTVTTVSLAAGYNAGKMIAYGIKAAAPVYVASQTVKILDATVGAASTVHTLTGYATRQSLVDAFEYLELHLYESNGARISSPVRIKTDDWKTEGYDAAIFNFYDAEFLVLTWADGTLTNQSMTAGGAPGTASILKVYGIKTATAPLGADVSAFGATLVDDADAATARSTLGLAIGTDVQAYSAVLDATTASFTTADATALGTALQTVDLTADVTGVLPIANIATGTPTGALFVRDDGTLADPSAGGGAAAESAPDILLTGDRVGLVGLVITGVGNYESTLPENLIDGVLTATQSTAWVAAAVTPASSVDMTFDFGAAYVFDELKVTTYQDMGNWQVEGSVDGATYVVLAASQNISNPVTFTWVDTTGYRYLRLQGVSGNIGTTFIYEVEFGAPAVSGEVVSTTHYQTEGRGTNAERLAATANVWQFFVTEAGVNYGLWLRDPSTGWAKQPEGDMLASNNLSDVVTPATARTNLGLAIGTDVQAYSAVLDATTASFTTADETKLDGIDGTFVGEQRTEIHRSTVGAVSSTHTLTGYATLDAIEAEFDYVELHLYYAAAQTAVPAIRMVAAEWKAKGYPQTTFSLSNTDFIRLVWSDGSFQIGNYTGTQSAGTIIMYGIKAAAPVYVTSGKTLLLDVTAGAVNTVHTIAGYPTRDSLEAAFEYIDVYAYLTSSDTVVPNARLVTADWKASGYTPLLFSTTNYSFVLRWQDGAMVTDTIGTASYADSRVAVYGIKPVAVNVTALPTETKILEVVIGAQGSTHTITGYATLDALEAAFSKIEATLYGGSALEPSPIVKVRTAEWKADGYPPCVFYGYSTDRIKISWTDGTITISTMAWTNGASSKLRVYGIV